MNYLELKEWLTLRINKKLETEEYDLLYSLIQKHPSYHDWKFNVPLSFKIIMKNAIQLLVLFKGMKKYRIVSWVNCVKTPKKPDPLTSAMRQAIRRQITLYKKNNLKKQCLLCESIFKIEVDHVIKFVFLKNQFLLNHVPPESFAYHPKRGYYMFKKCDLQWKKNWQKYHLKYATYRYLCSPCNKK